MRCRFFHGVLAILSAGCLTLRAGPIDELPPPPKTSNGFAVPQPENKFEFPRDHGSHPEFKIEWWYITGHLYSERKQRFGFQATFFRLAGPRSAGSTGSTLFTDRELHLAHMALLDVNGQSFLHQERLNRAGWDAEAKTDTLDVRNGNWSLRFSGNTNTLVLHGSIRAEAEFALQLKPVKPLVIFGTNGVSRKGADPTAASYYLTFPRLEVSGSLQAEGAEQPVSGEAWMDHEISSSQLGRDQAGWDWACLQLKDGRDIMVYRMRRKDGSTDPFSTLTWVGPDGKLTQFSSAEFSWTAEETWKSPATGGVYPVKSELRTRDPATGQEVRFRFEPLSLAQELTGALGGVPYWEGACRVLDREGREAGAAYLELTGYVGELGERLR